MKRFHVHLCITDDAWFPEDPVITVTINALDDAMAQLTARALLAPDLANDVIEIEETDDE